MSENKLFNLSGILGSADGSDQGEDVGGTDTAVVTRSETEIKEPSMFKVLLHNDDYTPMDFVVQVLEEIFHFDNLQAQKVMMDVHLKGMGCCGVFPFDIAETKVALVMDAAQENEYPLKCSMEK